MNRPFFITEVFAEQAYAGNQLATLPDAQGISSEEMQQIARAFNFAETTFILGGSLEAGFDVRIFTPAAEIPFAGHPTLGTSYLIREQLLREPVESLTLNLGVGPIAVRFQDDGVIWMRQNPPTFGERFPAELAADNLGLVVADIDHEFPVQRVSTGLPFILVPVKSYESLRAIRSATGGLAEGCFVFCRGGYNNDQHIQARMFANDLGVSEDPATGSANGCLAAYLVEHKYFGEPTINVSVGQGYEINRPSQLYLDASRHNDEFEINVGGKVRLVADGTWRI